MRRKQRTAEQIVREFQERMVKAGLGVTFSTAEGTARVTSYCRECEHVAHGAPAACPRCGSAYSEDVAG